MPSRNALLDDNERVRKAEQGREVLELPKDCAGRLEMWRRTAAADKPEIVVVEDLEQEIKLLRYRIEEADRLTRREAVMVRAHQRGRKVEGDIAAATRAVAAADLIKRGAEEQIAAIQLETAKRVQMLMYPGVDRLPASSLGLDDDFAVAWELWEEWGRRSFADRSFLENVEILKATIDRVGLSGLAKIVVVTRKGAQASKRDINHVTNLFALITSEEQRVTPVAGCFNRLIARRGARGLITVVFQVEVDNVDTQAFVSGRELLGLIILPDRCGARQRSPRSRATGPKAVARRGGDPPGGPGEGPDLGRTRHSAVAA